MQKLTKITASIGPASEKYETIFDMILAGANVCRLNFSHDTGDIQGAKIDTIRKISAELNRPIAIIADLQGPKHRIGKFKTEAKYPLTIGQEFVLDNNPEPGDSTRVQLPDEDVLDSLKKGDRVLLNDGKIELEVIKSSECRVQSSTKDKKNNKITHDVDPSPSALCTLNSALCSVTTKVVRGTEIWSRRGFNIPDTEVAMSVLTPKDRADLEYALTKNPDFVAISFVQKPEDVFEVRDFITAHSANPVKIIVKIERPQALTRFEEIADATDAVMVARGDLAVEMPLEQVPAIQRKMITTCRHKNKPVIVATQMLASMVNSEFPLRSEVADIANVAYLRADSTMTSEETAIGDHPVKTIETMAKVLAYTDEDAIKNNYWSRSEKLPENDWARSVSSVAFLNKAVAIVVFARDTARTAEISCRRPDFPIIAVCNQSIVANQLCLCRGVFPIFNEQMFGQRDYAAAMAHCGIPAGNVVVVDENEIRLTR